jgi:hypothetical protein
MTQAAKQAALAEKLAEYIPLPANGIRRLLDAIELCGYTITEDTAEQATATPAPSATVGGDSLKPLNGEPVTQEMLETLWRVVVEQDTPELEASFTVNCLRGTIKISPEMKLRLATPPAAPSDAESLHLFNHAVDHGTPCDELPNFVVETIREALTAPAKKEGE